MDPPPIIARILHDWVPHINISLHKVNSTFDPNSTVYIESLGILASIPAAILIVSLVFLLLYLCTRCCDRKSKKQRKFGCQKCTLIFITILSCGAIGGGLYGNDDLHNGLVQVFHAGKQLNQLFIDVRNQTELLRNSLKEKSPLSELDDFYETPTYNQTALSLLLDMVKLVKDNTSEAVSEVEAALYFIRPSQSDEALKGLLDKFEFTEHLRWPITLGFLTFLLFLCTVLIIGVARSSRCLLIFFSVLGLLAVAICWLLAGVYLAGSVAVADFCMAPIQHICHQQKLQYIYYTHCGASGTNHFVIRLHGSKDNVEKAKRALEEVERMSKEMYRHSDVSSKISHIYTLLDSSRNLLQNLAVKLDSRAIQEHYANAAKSFCHGGLFGLSLMTAAGLLTAFLLTILVCVDSHTWIYLTKKRPFEDKSETIPLFPTTSVSPTAPITSGTSTINRTLLHAQQLSVQSAGNSATLNTGTASVRNGGTGMRGLDNSGESPPPEYNVVVHDNIRMSGHHTLGRLPSHSANLAGPNNGKYATLSKQCKTLESNDFY